MNQKAQEHLAALAASIDEIESQRDAARAETTQSQAELTTARAEVDRLVAELETARQVGSAGINVSALTTDLANARANLARAEAIAEARAQGLVDLSQNLNDARTTVEAERGRREDLQQQLAEARITAAEADGKSRVDLARAEGENRLVTERSRQRWPWWALLIAFLLGCLAGYLVCTLCGSCNDCDRMRPVVPPTPAPKESPAAAEDSVPVTPAVVDPAPPVKGGRVITTGEVPLEKSGCCGGDGGTVVRW